MKTCTAAEVASCKKVANKATCSKSATAMAVKSVEKATCLKTKAACATKATCQKVSNIATATTVANKSVSEKSGNTCCGLPVSCCSKATPTSTGQLAEKMN